MKGIQFERRSPLFFRHQLEQLVSRSLMKQLNNDLGQNNSNLRNTDQTDKPVSHPELYGCLCHKPDRDTFLELSKL